MLYIILYAADGSTYGAGHYANDSPEPLPAGEIICTADQAQSWQDYAVQNGALVKLTDAALTARAALTSWVAYQGLARDALNDSDRVVLRCYENAVPVPSEWTEYRKTLRAIVSAVAGAASAQLPTKPPYPVGT